MLSVLGEELLLELIYAVKVAVAVELRALLHSRERSPALGIYYIGVAERLFHIVSLCEAAAALLSVGFGYLFYLGHNVVAVGMSEHNVHTEAGEQPDDPLRHAQRLAVAGRIRPGHGDLLALEILDSAEIMDDMVEISHSLGRVVDVALEVDEGRLLLEDAVLIALFESVRDLLLIGMALADVHIVADADDVSHKGDHVGGLADGLAVGDLALALVQILHLYAQQIAGRGKGEAGTGGVIAEVGDTQTRVEYLCRDIPLPEVAERVGYREDRGDLVVGLIPCQEEVVLIHLVNI